MKRENPVDLVHGRNNSPSEILAAACLWLALAEATLTLAQVSGARPPITLAASSFDSSFVHADAVVLQAYEPDPDLTEVTAKTFLDIQIDGKPAGSCMVATVKIRC